MAGSCRGAILVGGHPGAGKRYLVTQSHVWISENMTALLCDRGRVTSTNGHAANRLNLPTDKLNMLSETSVEQICNPGGSD